MSHKWLMLTPLLALCSCSPETGYSAFERTEAEFLDMLNGEVSPSQWWKTSVTLSIDVKTDGPVKVWLVSKPNGGTLFDYREVEESGIITMTAPQGKGHTLYLITVCGREKNSQAIVLSGKSQENVVLNATSSNKYGVKPTFKSRYYAPEAMVADVVSDEPDPVAKSLWGYSSKGNGRLMQLTSDQRSDWMNMMDILSRETQNAKTEMGLIVDYELESKGPFDITWIAGNCTSNTPHILGYYYHSPGTYEDIVYVDLCETELYDVVDGIAKVQYQVNQAAVDKYPEDNLVVGKWYSANFDINDRWERENPCMAARKGDNAWNMMAVFERYNRNISALRGLTFEIDVPAGMRVGFYDRAENEHCPDQYDKLLRHNVRPYTDRARFRGTSYSAESMNIYNEEGDFRSFIKKQNDMMWMGMENIVYGGDLDCNDVIFGVSAQMDIYLPSIVEPDLLPTSEYDEQMPWTIAYEDAGREPDFDFNDAVIKLVPDYDQQLCCVTVEAAGSPSRMFLHYDGPDGDINMGEIHELLSSQVGKKVNTSTSVPQIPFVEIDCVPWPKDFTMANDAKRFWIEIQRGTCQDCTDMLTLAYAPGQIPQALLVAGEWQWPMEGVHIFSAYSGFPYWAKDVSKTSYWNWYDNPKQSVVVSY